MLFLRADYSNKQNCNYSVYVSFTYNPLYVEVIKSLTHRSYDPDNKEWEVNQDSYNELMNKINHYNLVYNYDDFRASVNDLKNKVAKSKAIQVSEKKIDTTILDSIEFKSTPRDYQLEGIAYGLENNKFLNADSMGLGKSLQCIDTATIKRGGKHCLVIAGYATLLFNWANEIRKHSFEDAYILGQRKKKNGKIVRGDTKDIIEDINNIENIKEFFIVISISTVRHCIKQEYIGKDNKKHHSKKYDVAELLEEKCRNGEIGRIILDEAHVIKSFATDNCQSILKLKSVPYKIASTGTPIMNEHIDLFPIMTWLDKTNMNYWQFRDKYCLMGGFKGKQIIGNKNGDMLYQELSKFMIRRKKEDKLNLPDKIIIDEYLEMDLKQENLYNKTKSLIMAQMKQQKGNRNAILTMFTKLRQITDHPGWVDENYKDSVKFERILQLMNDINQNNQKAIIFSNWKTPIDMLTPYLELYNPAIVTGEVKLHEREEQIRKFQEDDNCKVILGTIGALGVGVTLTAASNVIFLDEPWNEALKGQAIDRAYRIGTKTNVNVYNLLCKNTLDEKVHKIIFEKGLVSEVAVDGMTVEEMKKLLEEKESD